MDEKEIAEIKTIIHDEFEAEIDKIRKRFRNIFILCIAVFVLALFLPGLFT